MIKPSIAVQCLGHSIQNVMVNDPSQPGGMPLNMISMDEIERMNRESLSAEYDFIRRHARHLHELVVDHEFLVAKVLVEQYAIRHTPITEMRMPGPSPSYETGFSSRTTLEVIARGHGPMSKIKKLNFSGFSTVVKNQYVKAKIPLVEEKTLNSGIFPSAEPHPADVYKMLVDSKSPSSKSWTSRDTYYVIREPKEEELAIELAIQGIYSNIPPLRIERSADYPRFEVPKKKNLIT